MKKHVGCQQLISFNGLDKIEKLISDLDQQINNSETALWIETKSISQTDSFSSAFWTKHSNDLKEGEFWADRIKESKNDPEMRLRIAVENLKWSPKTVQAVKL